MAGDIGIEEQLIVVPPQSKSMAAALTAGMQEQGTRIIHRYGPRVMIGELRVGDVERLRSAAPSAQLAAAPQALSEAATEDLDETGALGLAAFSLRQSQEYLMAKEQRPYRGAPWDAAGALPPDPPQQHIGLTQSPPPPPLASGSLPLSVVGTTSQRMTGSIAVGIVIVSGPTPDLQFSASEKQKVVAEVQNGLGWHASQYPAAGISFTYDLQVNVQVNVQPGGGPDKEALWRDPAMAQLGYTPNWQGVVDYVNRLRTYFGTQWSYVGFFTKYPLDWFAYASIGGPRLVMQYENDGWGPDNIDRVFAHETGHIFQAPDEYSASNCNCGGSWGFFNKANVNCQLCAPGGGVDCIMRSNSWSLCNWTPWHYGVVWPSGLNINSVDSTPASPATVVFNNKLYVVWRANDASNRIIFSASSDGATWPNGSAINSADSTPFSPAACVFNNNLYLFWRANDSSNRIICSASDNGTSWPNGAIINGVDSTPFSPAACVFNNKLYLFWKANDSSNRIFFSASSDGVAWPNGSAINGSDSTPFSPAACVFNNKLYLFWKANDSSNSIFFSVSSDGTTWPSGSAINGTDSTPFSPAACVFNNNLYLFWRANDSTNSIYCSPSASGSSWPSGRQINLRDNTSAALATAVFQNNPYVFWKANDSSNRILYSP